MSERKVPVTCSACGAQEMTFTQEYESADRRRDTLSCPCGQSTWTESMRREEVRAILCGPGSGGSAIIGHVWAPV